MADASIVRDTVGIDESVHDIYKQLTEGNDTINAPFRTMKDIFMWAVFLGYKRGERRPLTGKKITIFRWAQFDSQVDIPLLKALALSHTNDVNVLQRQDEILTIAEEYANEGIHEIRIRLLEEHGQPLWNLIQILTGHS